MDVTTPSKIQQIDLVNLASHQDKIASLRS